MKYIESIQKAVYYFEDRLKKEIIMEDAAEAAGFSKYHFHRVFQAFIRQSMAEHVRRRRLTKASHDLLHSKSGILTIAIDYQFESQASFTRSFKRMFGVSPGLYRRKKQRLQSREEPIISEDRLNHYYGGMPVEPRVVTLEAFKVIGMKVETRMSDNQIPDLWQRFLPRKDEITHRLNQYDTYGISEFNNNYVDDLSTYWACVPVESIDEVPAGMKAKTISGAQYVVITHKGKLESMGNVFDFIHTTWLPKSGYELDESDCFEVYGEKFLGSDNELSEAEIYIAIK